MSDPADLARDLARETLATAPYRHPVVLTIARAYLDLLATSDRQRTELHEARERIAALESQVCTLDPNPGPRARKVPTSVLFDDMAQRIAGLEAENARLRATDPWSPEAIARAVAKADADAERAEREG